MRFIKHLLHSETGATSIEYSFIAVLIAIAAMALFQLIGIELLAIFQSPLTGFAGVH